MPPENFCNFLNIPFYLKYEFWLTIASIAFAGFALFETMKLRKESQRQNILAKQPYLSLKLKKDEENKSSKQILVNNSLNPAFNIFVLFGSADKYLITKEGGVISSLGPNERRQINDDELTTINRSAILERIKFLNKLINKFETKSTSFHAIFYEDIFGNKMYSVGLPSLIMENGYNGFFNVGYVEGARTKNRTVII